MLTNIFLIKKAFTCIIQKFSPYLQIEEQCDMVSQEMKNSAPYCQDPNTLSKLYGIYAN